MTSNDRHAPHDSPYRTGQHVPVAQGRHAPLTSVTSAIDSTQDLSQTYKDDSKRPSISSNHVAQSPNRPYSPGMRSLNSPKRGNTEENVVSPGEIQMQNFADGTPPPPPVSHSWKKIDRWAEKNYQELWDQLGEGCTQNDVNELEHELNMSLPQDVRESLAIHDGQERGGRPTGIIFGCMLLDCEEIVQEWKNWQVVNEEYLSGVRKPSFSSKGLTNGASSSSQPQQNNRFWRQELLDRQDSQPPNAIQKAYAHPSWISLARDWGGNNIAVDLAPGPMGKWGQVILFGRDYDCKYVVAKSWAQFLATVADDLSTERVFVDEDSGELKLKEFKTETVEPAYMDILRWRADQKYGRRGPKRRPQPPGGINTNSVAQNARHSPYGSPVAEGERGRSPQRFSRGPTGSPRHNVSSPLARVQEEIAQPTAIRPAGDVVKDFAQAAEESVSVGKQKAPPLPIDAKGAAALRDGPDKLVDLPTPASLKSADSRDFPAARLTRVLTAGNNDIPDTASAHPAAEVKGLGVKVIEDEMKTVAI
jgi:cell wall assembly regulator SMI1